MRKGTVAATEMTTGWGLRTFTPDALDKLHEAKSYLRAYNEELFSLHKESLRILRKVKYS